MCSHPNPGLAKLTAGLIGKLCAIYTDKNAYFVRTQTFHVSLAHKSESVPTYDPQRNHLARKPHG